MLTTLALRLTLNDFKLVLQGEDSSGMSLQVWVWYYLTISIISSLLWHCVTLMLFAPFYLISEHGFRA